jgi:hypothetical protein
VPRSEANGWDAGGRSWGMSGGMGSAAVKRPAAMVFADELASRLGWWGRGSLKESGFRKFPRLGGEPAMDGQVRVLHRAPELHLQHCSGPLEGCEPAPPGSPRSAMCVAAPFAAHLPQWPGLAISSPSSLHLHQHNEHIQKYLGSRGAATSPHLAFLV